MHRKKRTILVLAATILITTTWQGAAPAYANKMNGKPKPGNCQTADCKRYYHRK